MSGTCNTNEVKFGISNSTGQNSITIGGSVYGVGHKTNIVYPCAGSGKRFKDQGYTKPKPFIDVYGKPMIQRVIENISVGNDCFDILIFQKGSTKFNFVQSAFSRHRDCSYVDGVTEGAACTVLTVKDKINNDKHLLIANSDQLIDCDWEAFEKLKADESVDGIIFTFISDGNPKWSYAKVTNDNKIVEVAEKNPISSLGSCGIYWFRKGSDFVKYAEQMIEKNIRTNNEFYLCPVYNEMIADGKNIKSFQVNSMVGLGTPEDLNHYMKNVYPKI